MKNRLRSKRFDVRKCSPNAPSSQLHNVITRRDILKINAKVPILLVMLGAQGVSASWVDSESQNQTWTKGQVKKPFAPTEALLPATRVKLLIDQAISLVDELISYGNNYDINQKASKRREEILMVLKQNLLLPKTYKLPLNVSTIDNLNKLSKIKATSNSKLYDEAYAQILNSIPLQDVPYAALVKLGEQREISILRNRQKYLEQQDPVREAFNIYTSQLQFDTEYYILNASPEEKKRMIRNDALPDIKSVIVSDLDLRDLIRNQILDAIDDSKAELIYQIKRMEENEKFDGSELKKSLLQAQNMMNQWFSFISEEDVAEAVAIASKEMTPL